MATRDKVKNSLDIQITDDAKARRQQVGDGWIAEQMDFYYGIGNEISVDIAVKAAMLRLLAEEHKILPDSEWAALRHDVNSTTVVDNAITRMQSASLRATGQLE
jgi:hypothetical protein